MPPRRRASRGAESSDGDGDASAWFGQHFGTGSADSAVTLTQQLATVGEPEQAARLREVQARPDQLRQQIQANAAAHVAASYESDLDLSSDETDGESANQLAVLEKAKAKAKEKAKAKAKALRAAKKANKQANKQPNKNHLGLPVVAIAAKKAPPRRRQANKEEAGEEAGQEAGQKRNLAQNAPPRIAKKSKKVVAQAAEIDSIDAGGASVTEIPPAHEWKLRKTGLASTELRDFFTDESSSTGTLIVSRSLSPSSCPSPSLSLSGVCYRRSRSWKSLGKPCRAC